MNDRQIRTFEALQAVVATFRGDGHTIAPEAPTILERLDATIADIRKYATDQGQATSRTPLTTARRQLDTMRQTQMLPLARLTRRIFQGESRIQAAMRVPHKRAPAGVVLAAAARMVSTLRPHRAVLAASRIDSTRLDVLQREVRRLKKVFEVAGALHADRAVPTRRLPELFADARMDVLALDALVASGAGRIGPSHWKRIRRVGKKRGRPRTRKVGMRPQG